MTETKAFKSLQLKQILLYSENSSEIFLTSLENKNDNIKSIIKDSEKDV